MAVAVMSLALPLFVASHLTSCKSEKNWGDAEHSTKEFMSGLQRADQSVLAKYYPAAKLSVADCFTPKAYEIDSIKYVGPLADKGKGDKATAFISFTYTNNKGVEAKRLMELFMQRSDTTYLVTGTRGLIHLSNGVYAGTIGTNAITMNLTIEGNEVTGTYYYNKQGANALLNVKGSVDASGRVELTETNADGMITGNFDLYKGLYGNFTSFRGQTFETRISKK